MTGVDKVGGRKFPATLGESWNTIVTHRDDALLLPQLSVALLYVGILAFSYIVGASGVTPSNFGEWLLAVLPLAAGLGFYSILRWSAWVAVLAGLALLILLEPGHVRAVGRGLRRTSRPSVDVPWT